MLINVPKIHPASIAFRKPSTNTRQDSSMDPSTEEDVNSTIEQSAIVFPKETKVKALLHLGWNAVTRAAVMKGKGDSESPWSSD